MDLPESILTLLENDIFEINWVKKNNNVITDGVRNKNFKNDKVELINTIIYTKEKIIINIIFNFSYYLNQKFFFSLQ